MTEHDPSLAVTALQTARDKTNFIPEGSPFDDAQRAYLNGMFASLQVMAKGDTKVEQTPLKVYFGSQTGTAEALCKELRKLSATKGFKTEVANMNTTTPANLIEPRRFYGRLFSSS